MFRHQLLLFGALIAVALVAIVLAVALRDLGDEQSVTSTVTTTPSSTNPRYLDVTRPLR